MQLIFNLIVCFSLAAILRPDIIKAQQADILFEFRSYPCEKIKERNAAFSDTIRKTLWINDSTLSVILQIQMNGAESILKGNYTLSDSAITLNYQITSCGDKSRPCAKWVCRSLLEYRFKGLRKNHYNLILNRTP